MGKTAIDRHIEMMIEEKKFDNSMGETSIENEIRELYEAIENYHDSYVREDAGDMWDFSIEIIERVIHVELLRNRE